MHTGVKPFGCTVCEKRFRQKNHLADHVCMHTGEQPFTCSQCSKTFAIKRYLRLHVKMHSDEKTLYLQFV